MRIAAVLFAVLFCFALCSPTPLAGESMIQLRRQAEQLNRDGLYKDALDIYQKLAFDQDNPADGAAEDLADAVSLANQLNQNNAAEALIDKVVAERGGQWRILAMAASLIADTLNHDGFIIDGEFSRDPARQGKYANAAERDRARAIALMLEAETLLDNAEPAVADNVKARFYEDFANIVAFNSNSANYNLFTRLTSLDPLPEVAEGFMAWNYGRYYGAPVDDDGKPLFYPVPASWQASANDGQRWRWLLEKMAELGGDSFRRIADWQYSQFLHDQFGVQTMAAFLPRQNTVSGALTDGPFAVRTLKGNETIARLATGIQRFTLPDEHNFIAILRRLSDKPGIHHFAAMRLLADIFENRQQYPKAVALWRIVVAEKNQDDAAEENISRVTGNVGALETTSTTPAGVNARLPYVFRNGNSVKLTAYKLDEQAFIQEIKDRIKQRNFDSNRRLSPDAIGQFVAENGCKNFIKEKTAEWALPLTPLPDHFSQRISIEMPFDQAGVYLVTAVMENGNTSRVVLWQSDLAIAAKTIGDKQLYYVADPVSGKPAGDATLSFFGYVVKFRRNDNRPQATTILFAEKSDKDGLVILPVEKMEGMNWLVTAETADGRRAFLGFSSVWAQDRQERAGESDIAYIITDRPVYRPGQTVDYKVWLGRRSYDSSEPAVPAGTEVAIAIRNPMGEVVQEKTLKTDQYGGVDAAFPVPGNSALGMYYLTASAKGFSSGVNFRIEEYKKPEFEVAVDSGSEVALLGDTVQVKVTAKYYFGSPVTDGKVKYTVTRSNQDTTPFPPGQWDWLYGRGYWWSDYKYSWLPGWNNWGIRRPPLSPPRYFGPPEIVAEGEGVLDAEGVFRFSVDTAIAKELFGNTDHKYSITAEVTDQSRRTIVGNGDIIAARKPFSITVWTDRGYYQSGQPVNASFRAYTPQNDGIAAKGEAVLYRLRYNAKGQAAEEKVDSWSIETTGEGAAAFKLTAAAPGQYRLACALTDGKGGKTESACVFTVRGPDEKDGDFRFADLELVPDRREYQPGDTLRLAVNSSRKDGVVLLFPRISGPAAKQAAENETARPIIINLKNGTSIWDSNISASDQPNFFCEAIMIADGKFVSEVREIIVPPADKSLQVEIAADKEEYLPGGLAHFTVKVSDLNNKPVSGQCVVAMYDKSVEYIYGGSNLDDIREAFWSWKRYYSPTNSVSLSRRGYAIQLPGDVAWTPLGIFGLQEMDWNDDFADDSDQGDVENSAGFAVPAAEPAQAMAADMAMPAPRNTAVATLARSRPIMAEAKEASPANAGGGMVEAAVRSEFADTAIWLAALDLNENGIARFELAMPDNLTTWKTRVWAKSGSAKVGEAEKSVVTRKNVIIRPQMPRFLTQKDQVVLSANIHNYLPRAKKATVSIDLEGGLLELADAADAAREITLDANGEARIDWLANAVRPGTAAITMRILTDEESDAAKQTLPIIIHGARTVSAKNALIRNNRSSAEMTFTVPAERLADRSRLELTFTPTLAGSLLEALPYLIDYPYGCTEQTLNRFLPAVMTRRYLEGLGASLGSSGDHSDSADASAQEWLARFGDARKNSGAEPVFDNATLDDIVKQGLERLASMQNADGGWGWFSGTREASWPHTTAVVVHGLLAARESNVAVAPELIENGVSWLTRYRRQQLDELKKYGASKGKEGKAHADNTDAFVTMVLADAGYFNADMRDFLYRDRLLLSPSGLAMFGLALQSENATKALDMVLANLLQYVEHNDANATAWLRLPASGWWWWYNDETESLAWYLKLLSRTDPESETTAALAKYLLENRKNASYWRSTRDTAYAIESLIDYAVASGETAAAMTVKVFYDGAQVMERAINSENLLDDFRFTLEGVAVESGAHTIRVERESGGNLYINARLDVFSLENPIPAQSGDLKVQRNFYRLTKTASEQAALDSSGRIVMVDGEKYLREHLPSPFVVATPPAVETGDLVEVELSIETANDYEYLVFEDMKAAGLESLSLVSGYDGNNLGAYIEYRDQKVVLFVRSLPKGKYNLSYRFRAETPGSFSALPTYAGGMYATDLTANADEMKIKVVEKEVYE